MYGCIVTRAVALHLLSVCIVTGMSCSTVEQLGGTVVHCVTL